MTDFHFMEDRKYYYANYEEYMSKLYLEMNI
jgi:hypothetical protein